MRQKDQTIKDEFNFLNVLLKYLDSYKKIGKIS